MSYEEIQKRVEAETSERHGKWSPWIPTIGVIMLSGIFVSLGFGLSGAGDRMTNQLGGFIVVGIGVTAWLIERSMLHARAATFNRLMAEYESRERERQTRGQEGEPA